MGALASALGGSAAAGERRPNVDLVGYWKLDGNCRDHSGAEHRGANLETAAFDGRESHVEVADAPLERRRLHAFRVGRL